MPACLAFWYGCWGCNLGSHTVCILLLPSPVSKFVVYAFFFFFKVTCYPNCMSLNLKISNWLLSSYSLLMMSGIMEHVEMEAQCPVPGQAVLSFIACYWVLLDSLAPWSALSPDVGVRQRACEYIASSHYLLWQGQQLHRIVPGYLPYYPPNVHLLAQTLEPPFERISWIWNALSI